MRDSSKLCIHCHLLNARGHRSLKYRPEDFVCVCGGPKGPTAGRCQICYLAQVRERQKVERSLDGPLPLPGPEAAEYGATVTFENEVGETFTLHAVGTVRKVVHELYGLAQRRDATFRIVCVSTPTSIYTDLQGARKNSNGEYGDKALISEPSLGKMAHPRLRGRRAA